MHRGRRRPGRSYGGFAKALASRGAGLGAKVAQHPRRLLEREARAAGQCHSSGYAVFGVDSTKLDCPMTRANEDAIGVAGRKKSWPRLLLTCLFHAGTNVPWAFKAGDAKSSERARLLELLGTLAEGALVVADAGFVGYEFFASVLASGRQLLVRVGANVKLPRGLHARARGDGRVYLWPAEARKKDQPPLVPRLVRVVDGRNRRMHLLTGVLGEHQLGDARAAELYAMRWSVELKFRALKQTMGRRKLLSDAPAGARAECDGSAVGYWMLEVMSWRARPGRDRSAASALRAVRLAMSGAGGSARGGLAAALAASAGDRYERKRAKKARHWPHKKRDKPPGEPVTRTATHEEIEHAARLVKMKVAA